MTEFEFVVSLSWATFYDYTQTPQCRSPFSIILLHTNNKLAGLYLHGSLLCKADSLALVSKDLQNTFRFYKIKSPLTSISLNKLKDLAAGRVVWRGEIARCKERKFLIST